MLELKREQFATQGVVFGLSALIQEYNITWACPEGLNHFNPNCDQSQISTQFPNEKQKNTVYHENLLLKRYQLNRHTIGFHLQTQKLEPPYKSPSFTHGLEWKEHKRVFTWENTHQHNRVSHQDDFLVSYHVYIMTGSFHISGEDFNPQSVLL